MNILFKEKIRSACFWQQAGVVKKKSCYKDFSCSTCQFEKAMSQICRSNEVRRKKGLPLDKKSSGFIYWKDRMKKMPLAQRLCIHHMKGHIQYKNCSKSYHCIDCEFDQYFYDQFKINAIIKPVAFDDIHGISFPNGFYLHPGHVWIKIEDSGMVRIGIDDFAAKLLGEFDQIDVPVIGKKLVQGDPGFSLMREQHKVDFVSPVNGVITQVNPRIKKAPENITGSPYTEGWICMVYCPDLKNDLRQLMFLDSSKAFMENKINRLYGFIEERTQLKAADGGNLVSDIFGSLSGVSWKELVTEFIEQKA